MIRRPPRSTLFPYTDALPIFLRPLPALHRILAAHLPRSPLRGGCHRAPLVGAPQDRRGLGRARLRSEEHTSELQSRQYLVCRLLLEKKNRLTQSTASSLSSYH